MAAGCNSGNSYQIKRASCPFFLCWDTTPTNIHTITFKGYFVYTMKTNDLIKTLRHFDVQHDYWLYSGDELALLFPEPAESRGRAVRLARCQIDPDVPLRASDQQA